MILSGAIAAQFLCACAVKENKSDIMTPIDWSAPQPIDERNHSYDEDADLREVSLQEEDIARIENELGLRVPDFLRRWMTTNPFRGFNHEPQSLNMLRDYLIGYNVELRRSGYYGRKWPSDLLWIGDDGGGGAYFVKSGDERNVFWYDWEEGAGDVVATENSEGESPEAFIESMKEMFNELGQ